MSSQTTAADVTVIGDADGGDILLTVSIITYNQHHLLPHTLDCVLAEATALAGVEVLVGDDGSTDGTADLLRDYAARYPGTLRVILGHRNVGICANGNRNLEHARGRYITFLGGDDVVLPGKLAAQLDFMVAHPEVGVCYHDVNVVYSGGGQRPWLFSQRHRMRRGDAATVIRYGSFFSANAVMVRADAVRTVRLRPEMTLSGDTLFFAEALAKTSSRIDFVPGVYLDYVRHGGNVTTTAVRQIDDEKDREMDILRALFPQYRKAIDLRQSDHAFILAYRALIGGHPARALRRLGESIRLAGWRWTAPRILVAEGWFRLRYRFGMLRAQPVTTA